MSKVQSMWVHGSSVRAEEEGYFVTKRNYKDGAVFKTHGKHWFQLPIPTPVIVDGNRAALVKCFVLYEAASGARICQLDLYDGRKQIKSIAGLSLSGDHSTSVDTSNSWMVQPAIAMIFGLAICVQVDFGNPQVGSVPNIRFAAAGADFLTG